MSQTSQALNNLSRTLMDRMRLVGDREQRLADMELRRNQLEYDLSRNRAADERAQFEFDARKPGLEAQRTRDAAEYGRLSAPFRYNSQGLERENSAEFNPGLRDSMVGMNQQPTMLARSPEDKLNTPVGIGQIAGSLGSVGHFISTQPGAPKETALVYKLGREVFDAAPIGGYYVRKDGTKVTQADFEANKQKIISLFDLETDVQKRYNEQSLKLMDVLNNPNVTPEQAAKIKEQIAIISDPAFRIQQLIQQRNRVKRYADTFGGEIVGEKLAKIDKDIAAAEKDIQASVKEDKDRSWDREKLKTEQSGMNYRTLVGQSEMVVNPKTGETIWVKPTEKVPEGFVAKSTYEKIIGESGKDKKDKLTELYQDAQKIYYQTYKDESGSLGEGAPDINKFVNEYVARSSPPPAPDARLGTDKTTGEVGWFAVRDGKTVKFVISVGEQGRQANDVGPNTTTDASKRVSSGASQPEGESESNRNLNGAEKTQKTVAKPEPKYTKYLKGDDGNIYGIRIDGQPVRIMKAEKPTVKYGIREYPNPDYGKYLEALEKYGLSEKANAKIGLMR